MNKIIIVLALTIVCFISIAEGKVTPKDAILAGKGVTKYESGNTAEFFQTAFKETKTHIKFATVKLSKVGESQFCKIEVISFLKSSIKSFKVKDRYGVKELKIKTNSGAVNVKVYSVMLGSTTFQYYLEKDIDGHHIRAKKFNSDSVMDNKEEREKLLNDSKLYIKTVLELIKDEKIGLQHNWNFSSTKLHLSKDTVEMVRQYFEGMKD